MFDVLRDTALLIVLSVAGGKVLAKLKCPAPEILGAMLFVTIGNVLGSGITVHPYIALAVSIGLGMTIGFQFNLSLNFKLIKEIALVCIWLFVTGLLAGRLLIVMGIDPNTALFAALPGGIVEMSFLSIAFDAEPFQVTLFHASRMVTLLIFMPFLIRAMPKDLRPVSQEIKKKAPKPQAVYDWPIVVLVSAAVGVLLYRLQVPAGAFMGSMASASIYIRFRKIQLKFPGPAKGVMGSLVGGVIGTRVTGDSLLLLPGLILPLVTLDIIMILSSLLLGYILYRISKMSRVTAQLAAVPGGFAPFVAIANSMGADVSRVAVFHLCRYLSMILFSVVYGLVSNIRS